MRKTKTIEEDELFPRHFDKKKIYTNLNLSWTMYFTSVPIMHNNTIHNKYIL